MAWNQYLYPLNPGHLYDWRTKEPTWEDWRSAGAEVARYDAQLSQPPQGENISNRIMKGLAFLDAAISVERSKEIQFMGLLAQKIDDSFDDEQRKTLHNALAGQDWRKFLSALQILMNPNTTSQDLDNLQRILTGTDQEDADFAKAQRELTNLAQQRPNFRFNGGSRSMVLKRQENQLMQLKEPLLNILMSKLNNNELVGIDIAALVKDLIYDIYLVQLQHERNTQLTTNLRAATEEVMKDFHKLLSPYEQQINILQKRIDMLKAERDALSRRSKDNDIIILRQNLNNTINDLNNQLNEIKSTQARLQKLTIDTSQDEASLRNQLSIIIEQAIQKVQVEVQSNKPNFFAEIESALVLQLQGALAKNVGGGIQAKPDNVATIVINGDINTDAAQAQLIDDYIGRKAGVLYTDGARMASENTSSYYQSRATQIRTSIEKYRERTQAKAKELSDWFVIEDSTKGYKGSRYEGTFRAGSIGPNLKDVLSKVQNITNLIAQEQESAFSNNLNWVLANSISPLIASPIQSKLFQYITMFAAFFLFDDQVLIWEDAIKKMYEQNISENNRLHLFSLDEGYYPLSFLLTAVKAQTEKFLNAEQKIANGDLASHGITLDLQDNGRGPTSYFLHYDMAEYTSHLKFETHFLNNISQIVNELGFL